MGEGDGMHVDETAELLGDDTDAAARVARFDVDHEQAAVGVLGHRDAAKRVAAPLHQAEHAQHGAFRRREADGQAVGHQPFSIICTLELLGGTSGHTFSRGSMRTWSRIGPSVPSRRSIASLTCERWSMVNASMPNAWATSAKSGLSLRSISEKFSSKNNSCHWRTMPSWLLSMSTILSGRR